MILTIWIGNQGPTDEDYKDGDIFLHHPDTWTPGQKEAEKWLNVKMADYGGSWDELTKEEYGNPPTGGEQSPIRRMRAYRMSYAAKLTPEELADVRNPTVATDIFVDRFTIDDIVRK